MATKRKHSRKAYLVYINEESKEKVLKIYQDNEFCIGRSSDCSVIISNPSVSRHHCKINFKNNNWTLTDNSTAGTFVNKEKITDSCHVIQNNDTITLAGPFFYPFHFFDNESILKKRIRISSADSSSNVSHASTSSVNENGNCENSNSNKSIILLSDEGERDSQEPESRLEQLEKENRQLIMQLKVKEEHITKFENLEEDLQFAEIRNKMNEEKIVEITNDLKKCRDLIEQKDNELKDVKAENEELKNSKQGSADDLVKDVLDMVENELLCSICSEIVIEATVLKCSHLYCLSCITQWLQRKKECAVCRAQVNNYQMINVRAVDSLIEKVTLKFMCKEAQENRQTLIAERNKEKTVEVRRCPRHRRRRGNAPADVPVLLMQHNLIEQVRLRVHPPLFPFPGPRPFMR